MFVGPETFVATIRCNGRLPKLAYLRDALTRGIIDDTGRVREKELLAKIKSIRGKAIVQPEWDEQPIRPCGGDARCHRRYPPPAYPGPAGLGGNYPALRVPRRRQAYLAGCGFGPQRRATRA